MIKKEYMKPTMNVVKLKTPAHILNASQVETKGLGEDLNYNGGSGDMEECAMSRRRGNVWDDDEKEEW